MDNCTTQRFSDEKLLLSLVHILKPYTFQSEFRTVVRTLSTGSSRKNEKSKLFVKISIFTKKTVFSTVLGQKLAANLCSTASKSTKITPRHPWKLAPLVCFQTLVGWLRQTIDLRFSAKAPTMCLSSQREKSVILTYLSPFTLLILSFTN